jgi:hypothetical protein
MRRKVIELVDTTLDTWGVTSRSEERQTKRFALWFLLSVTVVLVLQFVFILLLPNIGGTVFGLGVYTLTWMVLGVPLAYWGRKEMWNYLKSPQVGDVVNFAFASFLGARLSTYEPTFLWVEGLLAVTFVYAVAKYYMLVVVKERTKKLSSASRISYWYD